MTNLIKYYLYFNLFLAHCAGYGIMAKGLAMAHNRVDGFGKLLKLIMAVKEHTSKGLKVRMAHPLPAPRPDYGVTADDMYYYLPHSLLSLCSADQVQSKSCFCDGKFEGAKHFSNATLESQAVLAADPKRKVVVVSYRMSVNDKNWEANYKSDLVSHPLIKGKAKVHQGHLEYVQSLHRQLEPAVLSMLRSPKYRSYKLHITGYSLGASASAISLPIWMKALRDNKLNTRIELFTFSGPRPGNLAFAMHLESLGVPILRYAKKGDVVPHVADQSMDFSHVGQEFYDSSLPILKKSVVRCANNVMEDDKCSLRDTSFMATNHLTPFQRPLPTPPFC